MALTDTFIKNTKHSGKAAGDKHSDGQGLYLHITASGKYWRMAYRMHDKQKTLSIGVYPAVSLAQAREARKRTKELLAQGTDPGTAKREEKQAKAAAASNTFELVAREWLAKTQPDRATSTHDKITGWLAKDVLPHIGARPISAIGPRDVLAVLRKVEARAALESANRIKQICGQVFRYAVATGAAERDVTQDLKGALAKPAAGHFAAVTDPVQLGALLRAMDSYAGHSHVQAALGITPLVFVRPGELRTMEWSELDLAGAEWRIPGAKMKMGADHIVPLATQALALLHGMHPTTGHGRYVFPSMRTGERPMSENTINAALRAMGYDKEMQTAHGFRATARTIMDEVLGERVDLVEHQLAHAVKDVHGRAYNRTAHLPARRQMMQRWADYLDQLRTGAEVIQLTTKAA